MAVFIPFAGPVNATSDHGEDGIFLGQLERIPFIASISTAANSTGTRVVQGNADASGNVTYSNIVTATINSTINDVTLFDTVNPTADEIWIEMNENDTIESIDFYLTTAGVFSGTAGVQVFYKNASNVWVTVSDATLEGNLTSTGVKRITFSPISYDDITTTDYLINPRLDDPWKAIGIKFTGISEVTTSPLAGLLWKRRDSSAPRVAYDVSEIYDQEGTPDYTAYEDQTVLPLAGDTTLMLGSKPYSKIYTSITRGRDATVPVEFIYSKANGIWGTFPEDSIFIGSGTDGQPCTLTGDHVDVLVPPTDWVESTLTFDDASTRTGYWFGWRYIEDGETTYPIMLAQVRAQIFNTAGDNVGMISEEGITYTSFTVSVRESVATPTIFNVSNITTGANATCTLPENEYLVTEAINLPVAIGDELVVQCLVGDELVGVSDGFIRLA